MDKQLVAERLSEKYGVRVSVGLHRRIEDTWEERVFEHRELVGHDRVLVSEIDGVPILKPFFENRPRFAVTQQRLKVLVGQNVVDEGEKFTRADGVPIDAADIDAATKEAMAEHPTGYKTPTKAARIQRAWDAADDLAKARIKREARAAGKTVPEYLGDLASEL